MVTPSVKDIPLPRDSRSRSPRSPVQESKPFLTTPARVAVRLDTDSPVQLDEDVDMDGSNPVLEEESVQPPRSSRRHRDSSVLTDPTPSPESERDTPRRSLSPASPSKRRRTSTASPKKPDEEDHAMSDNDAASNATSDTEVRSHFTDDEDEGIDWDEPPARRPTSPLSAGSDRSASEDSDSGSDSESNGSESDRSAASSPAIQRKPNSKTRRVLSPAIDSPPMNGKKLTGKSRTSSPDKGNAEKKVKTARRRIMTSPISSDSDSEAPRSRQGGVKARVGSESESEKVPSPKIKLKVPPHLQRRRSTLSPLSSAEPSPPPPSRMEREVSGPTVPPPNAKAEANGDVDMDRVDTPPLPVAALPTDTRIPTPPLPAKEPTPPKEKTPPPPEPAKKVSLSEYLKNHKFRKEAAPVAEVVVANGAKSEADFVASVTATHETPRPLTSNGEAMTPGGKGFDMSSFLPSSYSTPGLTPSNGLQLSTPGGALSSTSFQPRTENFPAQPPNGEARTSSSFQPRASYAPRASTESETPPVLHQTPGPSSNYVPRSTPAPPPAPSLPATTPTFLTPALHTAALPDDKPKVETPVSYGYRRPSLTFSPEHDRKPLETLHGERVHAEPSPAGSTTALPPALAYRDAPPHSQPNGRNVSGSSQPPSAPRASLSPVDRTTHLPRVPPTGPKVPPSGPRGAWSATLEAAGAERERTEESQGQGQAAGRAVVPGWGWPRGQYWGADSHRGWRGRGGFGSRGRGR